VTDREVMHPGDFPASRTRPTMATAESAAAATTWSTNAATGGIDVHGRGKWGEMMMGRKGGRTAPSRPTSAYLCSFHAKTHPGCARRPGHRRGFPARTTQSEGAGSDGSACDGGQVARRGHRGRLGHVWA